MDWFAQYNHYRERTDYSFWSGPVNAVTNGWFVIAGIEALVMLYRRNAICPSWPLGTHFLWHSCNSLVLFLCWYSLYWHQYRSGNSLTDLRD